jgi:hypothetical protein
MEPLSLENFENLYIERFRTYVNITRLYQSNYYDDNDNIRATHLGNNEYILYDSEQNEFNVVVIHGQFYNTYDEEEE